MEKIIFYTVMFVLGVLFSVWTSAPDFKSDYYESMSEWYKSDDYKKLCKEQQEYQNELRKYKNDIRYPASLSNVYWVKSVK